VCYYLQNPTGEKIKKCLHLEHFVGFEAPPPNQENHEIREGVSSDDSIDKLKKGYYSFGIIAN